MVREMAIEEMNATATAPVSFQGMEPKAAIQKATVNHDAALKRGNHSLASQIYWQLKTYLDSKGYNWKQDAAVMALDERYMQGGKS